MAKNNTTGAPPGNITNGNRPPTFHGPKDCSRVPTPASTNAAASSFSLNPADRFSVLDTRNTLEIGVAAITNTCWIPNSTSFEMGRYSSTG